MSGIFWVCTLSVVVALIQWQSMNAYAELGDGDGLPLNNSSNKEPGFDQGDSLSLPSNKTNATKLSPKQSNSLLSGNSNTTNPCAANNGGCSHFCVANSSCSCPNNFSLGQDNKTCENNSDPCAVNNGGCSHFCVSNSSGYGCSCPNNFSLGQDNKTCENNSDPCAVNNGGCSHFCVANSSGYGCSCPANFSLGQDHKTCEDPCAGCNHTCGTNSNGNRCGCPTGFFLREDNMTCEYKRTPTMNYPGSAEVFLTIAVAVGFLIFFKGIVVIIFKRRSRPRSRTRSFNTEENMGNDNLASWPLRNFPDHELESEGTVSPQPIQQPHADFNKLNIETGGHCQTVDNSNDRPDDFSSNSLSLSSPTGTQLKTENELNAPDSPNCLSSRPRISSPKRNTKLEDKFTCAGGDVPAQGGFNDQDITDHGITSNTRTNVPVDSALRSELTVDGCFLDPEKYDPVKLLGRGGFAKVYLCIAKRTGKQMAVKMCDLGVNHSQTQRQTKEMTKEVKILSAVKHVNIVEFFYTEESHNTLLLFLEYMEGGSVVDLLIRKGPIQEPLVRKFTMQILTGVHFLHTNGIIHKDIKGGNVLLDKQQMNVKLADFGISKIMTDLGTSTGSRLTKDATATVQWASPELLACERVGFETDIWSVGCTVIEMLTGKPPLDEFMLPQRIAKISNLQVEPPPDCTSIAHGFLKQCLSTRSVRPSAAKLLKEDPFVIFKEEEQSRLAWLLS